MSLAWDNWEAFPLLRWQGPEGIVAVFSGRQGGVSFAPFASLNLGLTTGDDRTAVAENRRRLCAAVGADPARTVQNHQVHGAVVRVAEPMLGGYLDPQGELPQADALITRETDLALVVLAADCVPIVIAALDGSAVAVCHAGWKGLVAGVVEATVAALGPGAYAAAVGPCAGPQAYEVGDDVAGFLRERFGEGAAYEGTADLAACAGLALFSAGVSPDAIDIAGICTIIEADDFFSYRRDGAATGRQGVIAYRADR
ncbi:MAG: laccase domain-containing protein [Thermoleophilia bacterium]|nr:laccase domain-containing protein [Thermoleophilia bacterium]